MTTKSQILSLEMILRAYKAPLLLSRALYKSTLFMQNKPNLPDTQMNASPFITKDYENQPRLRTMKNKPNQTQPNPIQSQYKPNSRNVQIDVNLVKTRNYNNELRTIMQNKPNQTQFHRISRVL
jgi:hypothetical protein